MIRASYHAELKNLHNEVLRMGSIVEKQIYECVKALVEQDVQLAEKVISNDDAVDNFERDVESKAVKLIALQSPLATDLREIFTTTKIVTDLERIADHAVDIAKIVKKLENEKYIKKLIDIPRMAEMIKEMIRESLDAYVDKNIKKAYEICERDDEIDNIYNEVFNELLLMMTKDPSIINQASQFLFVCKYLERIGDHVTNICEWTIYLVTGELVDLNE